MRQPARTRRGLFLFVARAPVAGTTKTRLGATIGMEAAARLYRAFLVDLAARFTPAPGADPGFDFGWAYTPGGLDFARVLVGIGCACPPPSVRFVPQAGEGLTARLENAFRWAAEQGYARTVIAATDSPHLPRSIAARSLAALDDHEVAVGRTADGGYYLIGLRGVPDVLSGAPLSTGTEADALVARAAELGLRVSELPPTFDVDTEADLDLLRAALAPDGATAPRTWAALLALDRDRIDHEPGGA